MIRTISTVGRIASLIGLSLFFISAFALPRYEVVGGNLLDHWTGLAWLSLTATAETPYPPDPTVVGYRAATFDELYSMRTPRGLLPITFGRTISYSSNSDMYTALSFFATHSPKEVANCTASFLIQDYSFRFPAPEGAVCFSGWVADQGAYNAAFFWFMPISSPGSQIAYGSVPTLGPYSTYSCSPACFTVRAVPEPSQSTLLLTGMTLALLGRRKWMTRPYRPALTPASAPPRYAIAGGSARRCRCRGSPAPASCRLRG